MVPTIATFYATINYCSIRISKDKFALFATIGMNMSLSNALGVPVRKLRIESITSYPSPDILPKGYPERATK